MNRPTSPPSILYFSGDGARRDEDGYYWITGRVDDVLNVSGHRLGTARLIGAGGASEDCRTRRSQVFRTILKVRRSTPT
ncbi:hypothetical protein ACLK18_23135 [Escherichia coli]